LGKKIDAKRHTCSIKLSGGGSALIFDQNREKLQMAASSDESQEKAKTLPETSSSGPEGPDKKLPESLPSKPAAAAIPPAEPMQTAAGGSPLKAAEQPVPAPAVDRKTPVEQAKPVPAGTSSTDSLMKTILPAGESKTISDASAVKKSSKKIIAVGGAKGGVGKSILSANLAVGLALLGQKVVLADLDLGGADVHLYTGVKSLAKTWNDFLDKKVDSIQDILTPTAFKGLSLIGGDSSRLGSANLPYSQKLKIMRHLKEELETDFLIGDLGGDTTYNGLDFFLLADQKIVVSGTEPASVLDSYTFVKVVFNRFLERFFSERKTLKDLADKIKDGSLEASKNYSLDFIYQEVRTRDQQAFYELKKQFDQFRLSIVLNMTENNQDVRIAETMQKLVKDKCFVDIGILGTIPFDKAVRQAARGFTPIVVENPKCQASRNIHQMLAAIILHREQDATRAELLESTSRIRREAKEQIDAGNMTLDGLTVGQINSVFNTTPRLRQSFRKILNIITG
jgi:flagellar biosynthesis protein FlhG